MKCEACGYESRRCECVACGHIQDAALPPVRVEAGVRRVASLALPIPVKSLKGMVDALETAYGPGLTMREEPKGWLCIETPKPNNRSGTDGQR